MSRIYAGLCPCLLVAICALATPLACFAETPIDFVRDVQPILTEHCLHCHGADPDSRQSGLRLDNFEDAVRGGESGQPAIVPRDPHKGSFLERVLSNDDSQLMPPPEEKKPLSPSQITTLQQWIAQGAEYASHWAFVPPEKTAIQNTELHPIDALVSAKLASMNLTFAPPAEPNILCRRLYLDIIGLPPTPQELEEYHRDGIKKTVHRLLASERYGEKWARPWLDLARYSDTNGYEKDLRRDQWIWRDWVIAAINRDQPYDQFIIEQIAGDLLPNATQEQIIATGFLRNSPKISICRLVFC